MEVIIKSYDAEFSQDKFKGYIIFSPNMRKSAIKWGGEFQQEVVLPDELVGLRVYDYEDRLNNKIFKVAYPWNGKEITFDLYCDSLLEIMLEGKIRDGVILSEMVSIEGGKLVLKGGEQYNKYNARQVAKQEKAKKPKITSFVIGNWYCRDKDGTVKHIYLGKLDGKHVFVEVFYYSSGTLTFSNAELVNAKTPTFRFDAGVCPRDMTEIFADLVSDRYELAYNNISVWRTKRETARAELDIIERLRKDYGCSN